jgi:hypothetical protein
MKKVISTILITAMLTTSASAVEISEDWVNLSSWSYNDVSNFTNEGLLPDSFNGINDYRVDITREQFCELVYQVFAPFDNTYNTYDNCLTDTDNNAIIRLWCNDIVYGVDDNIIWTDEENDEYIVNENYHFLPDNMITREDAATIVYRILSKLSDIKLENISYDTFNDDENISDYAKDSVHILTSTGLISGMDNGSFNPKGNITIEQAITLLYRLYQHLPAVPKADGSNIKATTETELKSYDNGYTEAKLDNLLLIKNGDNTLMRFETDMYFKLDCVSCDDKNYVFARNFNKKTEVFDLDTHTLLFTIPYPVSNIENGYIHTLSSDKGQYLCGLYDFDGNEILPPEYSEYEIQQFIENGEKLVETSYRAADGWLYYSDENNGQLYKIDSNGENKQLLSDKKCLSSIHVINDLIYFNVKENGNILYVMKTDGSNLHQISQSAANLISDDVYLYDEDDNGYVYYACYNDSSLFYGEHGNVISNKNYIFDVNATLWRCKLDGDELITEKISDICLERAVKYGNKIYFLSDGETNSTFRYYLYCYDGEKVSRIFDKRISSFEIENNRITVSLYSPEGTYYIDLDGSNFRVSDNNIQNWRAAAVTPSERSFLEMKQISDDKYTIYRDYTNNTTSFYDNNENQVIIANIALLYSNCYRLGNIIYYKLFDKKGLFAYDMDAETLTEITDNCYSFDLTSSDYQNRTLSADDYIIYSDYYGNIYQIAFGSLTPVQIYPNKGLNRYEEATAVTQEKGIFKKSTSGLLFNLAPDVYDWSYAVNGTEVSAYHVTN